MNLKKSLKLLWKRPKNILNLLILSSFLGLSWTLVSVVEEILPDSYGVLDIGLIGLTMNVAGTIGGLVGSIYMEK